MDEDQPLVRIDDEDSIEDRNDGNEENNAGEQDGSETGRNDSHVIEQRNMNDDILSGENDNEPNFEDQPMPIFLEGAPNYPPISPRNGDEDIANIVEGEDNDDVNDLVDGQDDRNDRNRVVIVYDNRVDIDDDESNSDETESDIEDLDNDEGAIAVTSSSNEDSQNEDEDPDERETFDTELPAQHQYMGESREIGGRIILEENLYVDIPVISQPGIILMPGQTLPMTFFQPTVISMMKRLVETTKTFGILHKR